MYKQVYIQSQKENLEKRMPGAFHPVQHGGRHFIFSMDSPAGQNKSNFDHDKMIQFLENKGYDVEAVNSRYGGQEHRGIILHEPSKSSIGHLHKLMEHVGQESSIVSDGKNHELHLHHGPEKGKHFKGSGVQFHQDQPDDNYSTLSNGKHFSHHFDYNLAHDKSDFVKSNDKMQKSEEGSSKLPYIPSQQPHAVKQQGQLLQLVHYSKHSKMDRISPTKFNAGQDNPYYCAFYYLPGVKPESHVVAKARSKYIVMLGDLKLYDINRDPDMLVKDVMLSNAGANNMMSLIVRAVKEAGYGGFYNTGFGKTHSASQIIGIFESLPVVQEMKIHNSDRKNVSVNDHHLDEWADEKASQMAGRFGMNPKFAQNLMKFGK